MNHKLLLADMLHGSFGLVIHLEKWTFIFCSKQIMHALAFSLHGFRVLTTFILPSIVNGDLANSKKSTLLVEDFIKVDVLLVKVCHKRRKVGCAVRKQMRFLGLR